MEDRRLAAIMFTDIVGYTALMGSDEEKLCICYPETVPSINPVLKNSTTH